MRSADPGLLDHRDQRLFRHLPGLEKAREVAALPQLRHPEVQRSQPGIERAFPMAIPPGGAVLCAFVPPRTDQALNIGLYKQLQDGLRYAPQEIPLIILLQKLG